MENGTYHVFVLNKLHCTSPASKTAGNRPSHFPPPPPLPSLISLLVLNGKDVIWFSLFQPPHDAVLTTNTVAVVGAILAQLQTKAHSQHAHVCS